MIELIDMSLLAFMAVVAVTVARLRNLFSTVLVSGFFSLLSAGLFLVLDAVDVAFTEAAVGAGVATVILLGTLLLTAEEDKPRRGHTIGPLLAVLVTGATLVYGTLDMPLYGDPDAPVHTHVVPRYIERSSQEVGVPNIVTAVLASYRGYDTLGETTVIFTALVGVLLLIGDSLRTRRKEGES